ncbi:MAG: outer membrane lipoprotein carrier protein LolA [Proteobacteria bacterium]|nr:outer membrane lipoprotein carrier protein LolA [Pseudomonadota bacterium]NBX86053.1 outer membrane lipoprotein carrier protein LolA [Pseudomonadota bacterium]
MRGVYLVLVGLAMVGGIVNDGQAASVTMPVSSMKRVSMTVPKAQYVDDMKPVADRAVAGRKVEEYFNGMTTLRAEFSQKVEGEDFASEGTFYWRKPRQFLWQYETPVKQKIVGTGTAAYYVDQSVAGERGQVTQLPIEAGLGRLFAAKKLSLAAQGLQVVQAREGAKALEVVLALNRPTEADLQAGVRQVKLVFAKQPALVLARIEAADVTGATTRVSFDRVVANGPISGKLFEFTPGVYDER